MADYKERIQNLQNTLEAGEAALISSDISITYFTGFQHSEGYVVITKNNSYLFIDFRYIEAAQKLVKHMEIVMFSSPFDKIREILADNNTELLLLENESVTLSLFETIKNELTIEFDSSSRLSECIKNLRIVKTADEVEKLRKAQNIAEKAYLEVLEFVKVGVTEKEISAKLEYLMKSYGAERVAFELITVAGKKTSLPHGVPGDYKVQKGDFITFDIGAVYDGYHSDMTRTVAVGEVSEEQRKIYNIVLKAHLKALEAVKAGITGFKVDKIARDIITEEGYGEYFGHSTGHGVGLEIHESPYASIKSKDTLKAGMTLTVEPGIYLPDKFGVRIEDTVLVTENGYETFASIPKELIII